MANRQRHMVLRQTLELEVDKTVVEDQHAFLERLSVLGQQQIPRLLEQAVDEWLPPDVYRRLDRLEVVVELDRLEDLEDTLRRQLPQALAKALRAQGNDSGTAATDPGESAGPTAWILHFVRTGTLPWSAPQEIQLSELQAALHRLLLERQDAARQRLWVSALHRLLLSEQSALPRLLATFGVDELWLILRLLYPALTTTQWAKLRASYQQSAAKGARQELVFWQQLLQKLARQQQRPDLTTKPSTAPPAAKEEADTAETPLYLNHAGLILLHPFLPTLLRAWGWADERRILHPAPAAALLYSLATGTSPEGEWQLVLPKILLGLPLADALELVTVPPEQLAAGEELIQAAIEHWSVLGNTTVAGFRDSFLQRPGRLQHTENGWQLTLEQRPYDMLLDQLPWQLNYVQLPWMEEVIKVG
jgi:hypothetical protein